MKTNIASKESIARASVAVDPETKAENEVKESKIKRITTQDMKGVNPQKGSLKSGELKKKKAFE